MPDNDPFAGPTPEPPTETRRTFAEHIDEVRADVIKLAGLTSEAIGACTQALLDADLMAVEQVIANDTTIDGLKESVEFRVYEMFATQQPMAGDLRTLLAVLRMLQEIQLTADLTVTISKATRRLYPGQLPPKIRGLIERMGAQASIQLNLAVDAFADMEVAIASALPDMDDVMDDLQKELFRAIFESSAVDDAGIQRAVQLALIGRYYERIADHAVLIGAWTRFMVTGEFPSRAEQTDSGT
jgi:phosphate transport system protein